MRDTLGICGLLLGAFFTQQVRAATTVGTFTITGAGVSGSGTITLTTTATPGVDEITGITGTFSSTAGQFSGAITGLSPASYNSNSPTHGAIDTYDNLFYPSGSAPGVKGNPAGGTLDDYGLDFMVAGGYTVNVFEKGTATGFLLNGGMTSNIDEHVPITFVVNENPISLTGVVNAASGIPPGLPNYGIAQGSIFLVYGSNLGPTALQVASQPLPTTAGLAGTSITITVNGTTLAAPMYYTASSQVAAVMPSNTLAGTGTLSLTYNGNSASTPITVVKGAFGISNAVVPFANNGVGVNAIAAATFANYQYVSGTNTAAPGDTLTLWGTGLGPTPNNGGDTGPAPFGDIGSVPLVFVGGIQSPSVTYWGRSPNTIPGLDQIDFVVPLNAPLGCNVSIVVQTATPLLVSNGPTIALADHDGVTCSDPTQPFTSSLLSKSSAKVMSISLNQSTMVTVQSNGTATTTTTSQAAAQFFQATHAQLAAAAPGANSQPSFGSCYTGFSKNPGVNGPFSPTFLNAGASITLTPPSGAALTLAAQGVGVYGSASSSTALASGTWSFSNGAGGSGVGPLSFTFPVPEQITWSNQAAVSPDHGAIDRTQPLTITWSGGDANGYVDIQGAGSAGGYIVGFECAAPTSAGQFTIPSSILLAMPTGASAQATMQVSTYALPYSLGDVTSFDAAGDVSTFETAVPVIFK
jgi:uncharacterized protein (TIGR03437 family)